MKEDKSEEIQNAEAESGSDKPFAGKKNGKTKPAKACDVMSMTTALSTAGWPVEKFAAENKRPQDEFLRFIMTDPASLSLWRRLDPQGTKPPSLWQEVLVYATNRFLKKLGYNAAPVSLSESAGGEKVVSVLKFKE